MIVQQLTQKTVSITGMSDIFTSLHEDAGHHHPQQVGHHSLFCGNSPPPSFMVNCHSSIIRLARYPTSVCDSDGDQHMGKLAYCQRARSLAERQPDQRSPYGWSSGTAMKCCWQRSGPNFLSTSIFDDTMMIVTARHLLHPPRNCTHHHRICIYGLQPHTYAPLSSQLHDRARPRYRQCWSYAVNGILCASAARHDLLST